MGRMTDQIALQKAWEARAAKFRGFSALTAQDQENLGAAFKDGFQAARDYYCPLKSHIVEVRIITRGDDTIEPSDVEDALTEAGFRSPEVININEEKRYEET